MCPVRSVTYVSDRSLSGVVRISVAPPGDHAVTPICRRCLVARLSTLNPLRNTCWSRYSDHLPQPILSSFSTNLSRPADGSEDSLCLFLPPMSIVLACACLIRNGKFQLCRPWLFRSYNGSGSDRGANQRQHNSNPKRKVRRWPWFWASLPGYWFTRGALHRVGRHSIAWKSSGQTPWQSTPRTSVAIIKWVKRWYARWMGFPSTFGLENLWLCSAPQDPASHHCLTLLQALTVRPLAR